MYPKLKKIPEKIVGDIDVSIHKYNLRLECCVGSEKTVRRLLERKKFSQNELNSALDTSLQFGRANIVEILLQYGVELQKPLVDRVLITVVPRNLEVTKFLFHRGANFHILDHYPITEAIKRKSFDVVRFLVENRADVIPRLDDLFWDRDWNRDFETVKVLVELGLDITENDSALFLACERGRIDTVRYLIEQKANVNLGNDRCIRVASENDRLNVVEILLQHGANPKRLTTEYKEYFKMKKYYRKWRLIHHVKWIRRVLIPLYFSPKFQGGIEAKNELRKLIFLESDSSERNGRS